LHLEKVTETLLKPFQVLTYRRYGTGPNASDFLLCVAGRAQFQKLLITQTQRDHPLLHAWVFEDRHIVLHQVRTGRIRFLGGPAALLLPVDLFRFLTLSPFVISPPQPPPGQRGDVCAQGPLVRVVFVEARSSLVVTMEKNLTVPDFGAGRFSGGSPPRTR